jgi:hypothetical protein
VLPCVHSLFEYALPRLLQRQQRQPQHRSTCICSAICFSYLPSAIFFNWNCFSTVKSSGGAKISTTYHGVMNSLELKMQTLFAGGHEGSRGPQSPLYLISTHSQVVSELHWGIALSIFQNRLEVSFHFSFAGQHHRGLEYSLGNAIVLNSLTM